MDGDFVPAIIVQGGGFALEADRNIYKSVTEHAANVGYYALDVSVLDILTFL